MSGLSITLDDDLHRALKESVARQGRSLASIIEESQAEIITVSAPSGMVRSWRASIENPDSVAIDRGFFAQT